MRQCGLHVSWGEFCAPRPMHPRQPRGRRNSARIPSTSGREFDTQVPWVIVPHSRLVRGVIPRGQRSLIGRFIFQPVPFRSEPVSRGSCLVGNASGSAAWSPSRPDRRSRLCRLARRADWATRSHSRATSVGREGERRNHPTSEIRISHSSAACVLRVPSIHLTRMVSSRRLTGWVVHPVTSPRRGG